MVHQGVNVRGHTPWVHAPFGAVRVAAKGLRCQQQNPALRSGLERRDLLGGEEVVAVQEERGSRGIPARQP